MSPDRPSDRPPAVVLFAPALDDGVQAPPPGTGSGSPSGPSSGASAGSTPGASGDSPIDRLAAAASAAGGARPERRSRPPLPWESRLMMALDLLAVDADPVLARSAVPLARLIGPGDLAAGPVGPRQGMGGERRDEWRVVADFVSLSPGRDEATLVPNESLGLTSDDARALADAANELLAEDGMAFVRGESGRWYLEGLDPAALQTPPGHFLARREIGAQLPGSSAAAPWRRLMAEIEMLWHAHPVSEAREARGLPPVNGVWFWGGAALPAAPGREGADTPVLLAVDPLARALGAYAEAVVLPSATTLEEALATRSGDTLVVVDLSAYEAWLRNDADALEAARESSVARLVRPAIEAVVAGRAASFTLVGDAGEARVEPPPRRGWLARLFGRKGG